jgi:hypothetical protein
MVDYLGVGWLPVRETLHMEISTTLELGANSVELGVHLIELGL